MKLKKPLLTKITVSILCILIICTFLSRTVMASMQTSVETVCPERTEIVTYRDITGEVQYENIYQSIYDIPLKVINIFVQSGDKIKKGDIIMEVDCRELALELKKKELNLLQLQKSIENSGGISTDELKQSLEITEEEITLFKDKYPTDGKVYAGCTGIVYEVNAVKGEIITQNTSLVSIYDDNSPANVIFYLPENDAKFFDANDSVILYYSETMNYNGDVENVAVQKNSSIANKQFILKDNLYKFYVPIESDYIYHRQQIQLKIVNKSPVYDTVIPCESLYPGANNIFYVYIVKSRDGIFGKEYYIQAVNVEVLYENNVNAAVSGNNISSSDNIVVSSSKLLIADEAVNFNNK